jgi:hypothetical protein
MPDHRPQSGQTLIMFAITMTFMFLSLIALVGDADVLMVRYNEVNSEALLGAQAGATAIDEADLYNGTYHLNRDNAAQRCESTAIPGGQTPTHRVKCTPDPNPVPTTVTADVSEDVDLPVPLFMARATVRASRSARAVFGGQQILAP